MRRIIYFIVVTLLLASCAGSGGARKSESVRNEFADLPSGALIYISIDADASKGLVYDVLAQYKLNTKTIKTFFDITDRAVIAVYPSLPEAPAALSKSDALSAENAPAGGGLMERRFLLVGYGKNYPAGLSSVSFFFDPAWKKEKSITGGKYWRSSKNNVSLFMQKNRTHISDADPFFTEDAAETPENFALFSDGSCVSAWLTGIGLVNRALERINLPITIPATALFAAVFPLGDDWRIAFRLETPAPAQARGLVSVLSMARGALAGNYIRGDGMEFLRLLLSEPPEVDGSAIVLKSPPLPQSVLSGLITSLSIYLK